MEIVKQSPTDLRVAVVKIAEIVRVILLVQYRTFSLSNERAFSIASFLSVVVTAMCVTIAKS